MIKKILATSIVAMLIAVLVAMPLAQVSAKDVSRSGSSNAVSNANVLDNPVSNAKLLGNKSGILYEKPYDFDIIIPSFGSTYSDTYTMSPGKYVKVYLRNAGGHSVNIRVVDANTMQPLGDWKSGIVAGQNVLLWTNTTGETKYVKMELGADSPFHVEAIGTWLFGWF